MRKFTVRPCNRRYNTKLQRITCGDTRREEELTPLEKNLIAHSYLYRDPSNISLTSNHLNPRWEPKLLDFINGRYFQNTIVPKLVAYLNDTTDLWEEDFQAELVELMAQQIASSKRGLGVGKYASDSVLNFKSVYNRLWEIASEYGHSYGEV